MHPGLAQLIRDYATEDIGAVEGRLLRQSKTDLVAMLTELLDSYYNDLNSSTLRETVVALLAGYQPIPTKLGYDGSRKNPSTGATEFCEIKPKNVRSDSPAKSKPKLNGSGTFTDYSWGKFERHQKENPQMLVAGFVDGRLIHIFEFSFNTPAFTNCLRAQLGRRFPNGDRTGEYLRGAYFTFKDFARAPDLQTACLVSKQELARLRSHVSRNVFPHLWRSAP